MHACEVSLWVRAGGPGRTYSAGGKELLALEPGDIVTDGPGPAGGVMKGGAMLGDPDTGPDPGGAGEYEALPDGEPNWLRVGNGLDGDQDGDGVIEGTGRAGGCSELRFSAATALAPLSTHTAHAAARASVVRRRRVPRASISSTGSGSTCRPLRSAACLSAADRGSSPPLRWNSGTVLLLGGVGGG
ncbi:hypothetical protein ACFXKX_04745 [Streptomyces scopuliridis]|uniref:hypothetical protein n=1 Tax=Streptomyces scopuliridis TaxID=452529 RepID=UPI0036BFD87A